MASLNHPAHLKYTESDEWVRLEGEEAIIGITDYAQDQLGDIVYIELPWQGNVNLTRDQKFGDIESVKATSELVSPLSGTILRVNEALKENPEVINEDPYEQGWMLAIRISNPEELEKLLDSDKYVTER
jgi:glycine cleavage system H protein